MGPTASGKTALALALAEHLGGEIVSVDSALIYRGMDIGTAKPGREERARIPHHLIDILDPAERYSAERFCTDARIAMAEIRTRGAIPILAGGTMLYFRALQQGLSDLPDSDPEIRGQLAEEARRLGANAMHRALEEIDPEAAERIHPNDPQRVQRALEVYRISGRPMSDWWREETRQGLTEPLLKLVCAPFDRPELHRRIAERFDAILATGFEAEVQMLIARGDLSAELPSIRSVGYRQMWAYLRGELSQSAMRERAIIATRQLAKRQMTWLRTEPDAHWLPPAAPMQAPLEFLPALLEAAIRWIATPGLCEHFQA